LRGFVHWLKRDGKECQAWLNEILRSEMEWERLKAAGVKWNPEEKFWHIRYGKIRGDAELER